MTFPAPRPRIAALGRRIKLSAVAANPSCPPRGTRDPRRCRDQLGDDDPEIVLAHGSGALIGRPSIRSSASTSSDLIVAERRPAALAPGLALAVAHRSHD